MGKHTIRIRIPGENTFTEEFRGPSVEAAKDRARIMYPDAAKISWVGGAKDHSNDEFFADNARKVRENNERVFGVSGRNANTGSVDGTTFSTRNNNNSYDDGDDYSGEFLLWCIKWGSIGFVGLIVIYAAIITAPIIGAIGSAKVADKALHQGPWHARVAGLLLVGFVAFTGTAMLQQEYMPEFAADQRAAVTEVREMFQ